MIILNVHVLTIAHRLSKVSNTPEPHGNHEGINVASSSPPISHKRGVLVITALIVLLAVCWMPITIGTYFTETESFQLLGACLVTSYGFIHPLLYSLGNKAIRQHLMCTCKCTNSSSEILTDSALQNCRHSSRN